MENNINTIAWTLVEDDLFDQLNHVVNIFKIRVYEWQKYFTNVDEK